MNNNLENMDKRENDKEYNVSKEEAIRMIEEYFKPAEILGTYAKINEVRLLEGNNHWGKYEEWNFDVEFFDKFNRPRGGGDYNVCAKLLDKNKYRNKVETGIHYGVGKSGVDYDPVDLKIAYPEVALIMVKYLKDNPIVIPKDYFGESEEEGRFPGQSIDIPTIKEHLNVLYDWGKKRLIIDGNNICSISAFYTLNEEERKEFINFEDDKD